MNGIGIDIVEIERFGNARFKKRLAEFFLTARERKAVPSGGRGDEFLAGRFAAKEAVIKASPLRLRPLDFEIAVRNKKPVVVFTKKFSRLSALCSIAHCARYAIACALIQNRNTRP